MKYVLFSLSDEIILPETKRDGTKKRPKKNTGYMCLFIFTPSSKKQADLLLYITGRCLSWSCLHYHHFIISFDVMMLLLSFRDIWNFEVRPYTLLSLSPLQCDDWWRML
jgi:hypothetical protein